MSIGTKLCDFVMKHMHNRTPPLSTKAEAKETLRKLKFYEEAIKAKDKTRIKKT